MRTSLLDICKSEYRRLLGLPTCREIALGFVRAMRAARPDSLCPLVRATDPVPALLQGVIQCSTHCFNFRESFLASDGGVMSYYRCMYAYGAGIQPGSEIFQCSCGAINANYASGSVSVSSSVDCLTARLHSRCWSSIMDA